MKGVNDSPHPIRVLVVDDSAFTRMALTRMIESDPALCVTETAQSGQSRENRSYSSRCSHARRGNARPERPGDSETHYARVSLPGNHGELPYPGRRRDNPGRTFLRRI